MGTLMQDFKRQASFFLREKIKKARLVLTDVTPAQILTEEVTNGDSLAADGQAMRIICRAAFEVDDYDRITQILHERLSKFDEWNWKASYKALVLLEYLLTHGPQRIAEEFETDQDTIEDMATFNYVDDKGFNWGLSVKKKSERIVRLLQDRSFLKEERETARKVTVEIKGFGSFSKDCANCETVATSNSPLFGDYHHDSATSDELSKLLVTNNNLKSWSHTYSSHDYSAEEDHPFWGKEHHTRVSLLSSV